MKSTGITYSAKQSIISIVRNSVMSVASVLVLTSCLLVLGTFYALKANVSENLKDMAMMNEIAVYIDTDCTDEETAAVSTFISSMQNEGIVLKQTISKEEALASEKEKFSDYPDLFATLEEGDNPYRTSFILGYEEGADLSSLEYKLYDFMLTRTSDAGTETKFAPIDKVVSHADVTNSLNELQKNVNGVLLIFMVVLFVVSIFIIINTVRLTVSMRRKEISVMRYVGASGTYVTMPFVFEGIIMGVVSVIAAFFVQWIVYARIAASITKNYMMISVLPFSHFIGPLLLIFALTGILAGVAGSLISVWIYVREG